MLGPAQYINPDYVQPLPTSLDAKNSPLALLAQTCSSIGKEINSNNNSNNVGNNNNNNINNSNNNNIGSSSSSSTKQQQQLDNRKDRLTNYKDNSIRIKSSDSTTDQNGYNNYSNSNNNISYNNNNANNYNNNNSSNGYKCSTKHFKENGNTGRSSVSPSTRTNKSSNNSNNSNNYYSKHFPTTQSTTQPTTLNNNNKHDLLSLYRNSFYNHFHPTKLPEDYFNPMYPPFSKLSPSAAAVSATTSPTSTFKSQQEMLQAALAYSYSPWLLAGQSPFLPMSPFDPFLLSAAAFSAQQQQQQQQHKHLLMQHLQQQQHLGALTGQKNFDYCNDETAVNLSPSHSTPSPKINSKTNSSQKSSPNNNKNDHNSTNNHHHNNNATNCTKKRPISPASSSSHGKRSPNSNISKPFPCNWLQPGSDFCGRRFESYEELLDHLKTHVAETTPSIPTSVDGFKNDLATLPLLKSSQAPTATSSPSYEDGKLFPPHLFPFLFSSTHQTNPYSSFVGAGLYLQQQQQFQQQQQQLHQQLQQHQQHSPRSSSSPSSHHSPTNRFHPYKPSSAVLTSSSSFSSASLSSLSSSSSIPSSLFQSLMPTLMPLNTMTPPSLMTSSSYGGLPFPPVVLPQRCNETAS